MNTWFVVAVLIVCVMVVGYVEDPCTTEGLMQGCMQKQVDTYVQCVNIKYSQKTGEQHGIHQSTR